MLTITVNMLPFLFKGSNCSIIVGNLMLMGYAPNFESPEAVVSWNIDHVCEQNGEEAALLREMLDERTLAVLRSAWRQPDWHDDPETTESLVQGVAVVNVRWKV